MSNALTMPWWEREALFTQRDKEAVSRARVTPWEDIREDWAETAAGKAELRDMIRRKFHMAEASAGMI